MYKNNQLWNRYFPRSQRISYRYRETPWCPSIYFIDLNQFFFLLFLLTITKQKYFSSSSKIFFLLHCLWIYSAFCGLTSVLREIYCYDLLHLGVSKQKIITNDVCKVCQNHRKDVAHALHSCLRLDDFWQRFPLWNHSSLRQASLFIDLLGCNFLQKIETWPFSL